MSEMFDKRFVHFMWDDSLKGKVGFFADSIEELIEAVNRNASDKDSVKVGGGSFPFCSETDTAWKFFYHDPLYEYRWVHEHEQGKKKVQVKLPLSGWSDMPKDWTWDYSCEYRIVENEEEKPTRLNWYMLAMWLAKGNGQAHSSNLEDDMIISSLNYNPVFGADTLDSSWQVRRWDDTVWHEPTVDYCFPEVSHPTPDEIGG